jgi:hypothetical protein
VLIQINVGSPLSGNAARVYLVSLELPRFLKVGDGGGRPMGSKHAPPHLRLNPTFKSHHLFDAPTIT